MTRDDNGRAWRDLGGRLHRDDGPALETKSGIKYWFCHGDLVAASWDSGAWARDDWREGGGGTRRG